MPEEKGRTRNIRNKAKRLLHFSFSATSFADGGNRFVDEATARRVQAANARLATIVSEGWTSARPAEARTRRAYLDFLREAPRGEAALRKAFHIPRRAIHLAWALRYREGNLPSILDAPHLEAFLTLLREVWHPRMVVPLLDALLDHWASLPQGKWEGLRGLIADKIGEYEGKRRFLLDLRRRLALFTNRDGPYRAARLLLAEEVPLEEAPAFLGMPEPFRHSEYFARLVYAYGDLCMARPNPFEATEAILRFLESSEDDILVKIGITPILCRCDDLFHGSARDRVASRLKRLFRERIGDPGNEIDTRPWPHATREEREAWRRACQVVNQWITRHFIERFFDKIVFFDQERKDFWLRYVSYIDRFKIYVNDSQRHHFERDVHLAPYLSFRLGRLSGSTQNAIMMEIKGHIFVEFARKGDACYVYRATSPDAPKFERETCSIWSLKSRRIKNENLLYPYMKSTLFTDDGRLVTTFEYFREPPWEGRVLHKSDWEGKLARWIEDMLGIPAR